MPRRTENPRIRADRGGGDHGLQTGQYIGSAVVRRRPRHAVPAGRAAVRVAAGQRRGDVALRTGQPGDRLDTAEAEGVARRTRGGQSRGGCLGQALIVAVRRGLQCARVSVTSRARPADERRTAIRRASRRTSGSCTPLATGWVSRSAGTTTRPVSGKPMRPGRTARRRGLRHRRRCPTRARRRRGSRGAPGRSPARARGAIPGPRGGAEQGGGPYARQAHGQRRGIGRDEGLGARDPLHGASVRHLHG